MKKLSKRDEQLLLVFIVLVIIVAIYYLMIIPFKNKLDEANLNKELARDEYEELISANDRPEIFQENLDRLLEVIEQKEGLVPEKIEKVELLDKAIRVQNMLPGIKYELGTAELAGDAVKNKIVISFTTTYVELERLINNICNMPEKTGVDNIKFTIENNRLTGSMDVYFYSKSKA